MWRPFRRALLGAAGVLIALSVATAQTNPARSTAPPGETSAQHKMVGQVTKVDAKSGWIDIKTAEGRMKLHFPPAALQGVKVGDQVAVDLALKR
jgi:hypothetical protein